MIAALLVPVHIVLNGIAEPLGWVSVDHMRALVSHPLTKLYLFVLFALPFFHCAHRFRHVLYDIGLRGSQTLIAVLCYGVAIVAAVATGAILLSI